MSIWKWLGLDRAEAPRDVEGVDRIEQALDGLEPTQARYVACFAFILTRSARADHAVTDGEARAMANVIAERGGIPADQASLVVEIARRQALRSGGTDDYIVTREFNALATREQKLALLDCLFAVSAADASILTVEENEIRRVANELKLEHGDYIAVRASHLKHLAVMQGNDKRAVTDRTAPKDPPSREG
jgi:uncharacterized tellurite resistance protein B-like protein